MKKNKIESNTELNKDDKDSLEIKDESLSNNGTKIKDVDSTKDNKVKFVDISLTPLYFVLFFLAVIDFICYGFMAIKLDEYALSLLSLVIFIVTIYYALIGYKKKKSQVLRLLLLGFSLTLIFIPVLFITYLISIGEFNIEHKVFLVLNALASCISAFIAGRIHHYNNNKMLVLLIFALLLTGAIIEVETFNDFTMLYSQDASLTELSTFDTLIINLLPFTSSMQWGCLMIAYTIKFQSHELRKSKHHKH